MGSALGGALSMTSSTSWSDIVTKIKGVVNQGSVTSSLNCGGSYTIPAGYHNGSGKITANSLSSQTDATASAGQILSGYTAWVKGSKITGTMANKGALNWSGSNTTYTVPAGYYSGGTLNSKTSYTNGYNAGVTAGKNAQKAAITVKSGTVSVSTTGTVVTSAATKNSCAIVTIQNIGITPLAMIVKHVDSGYFATKISVNGSGTTIVETNRIVTSSHSWSSSQVQCPTWTTRTGNYNYWIVGY